MKSKLIIKLILIVFLSENIYAQTIQLIMSPKPSPYISDWKSRTETVTLIITNSGTKDISLKLKTELFDGSGSLIAYTISGKMPVMTIPPGVNHYNAEDVFPTSAITYKGKAERTVVKTGRIPDDNYKICISLTDHVTGSQIGNTSTVCKFFTITAYMAPVLLSPKDGENILEKSARSIFFRWTPVTPSPSVVVTYRLIVFEVLPGQEPMTAIRSNQPLVEKDNKGVLQTQWPVEFLLPEAGKKYVWTVIPLDEEGRKILDEPGFAQPFGFSVMSDDKIKIILMKPKPGTIMSLDNTKTIDFEWTNVPNATSYRLKIYQLQQGEVPSQIIGGHGKRIPIMDRDINTISYAWKVNDEYLNSTEESKFAWTVQAIDKDGNIMGEKPEMIDIFDFSINCCGGEIRTCCDPVPPDVSNPISVKMYSNIKNERGVKGVGIYSPGMTSYPDDCNKPNGLCHWAQFAPTLDTIQSDFHNVEVFPIDNNKLRFVFIKAPLINEELDRKNINGSIEPFYLETYLSHIMNHYLIPKDIAFSNADSKRILLVLGKTGSTVVLKQGDYQIFTDEQHKYGYFDVFYSLDTKSTMNEISVKQKGKDWYFTTTVSAIKNLMKEGTASRMSISGIPFACQYDFNNCCSRIGLINGVFTNSNYSMQDYNNCINALYYCIERRQYTDVEKLPDDWRNISLIGYVDNPRRPDKVHVKLPLDYLRLLTNKNITDVSVTSNSFLEGVLFEFTVISSDKKSGRQILFPFYLLLRRQLLSSVSRDTVIIDESKNNLTFKWGLKQPVLDLSILSYTLSVYENTKNEEITKVIANNKPIFDTSTKENSFVWVLPDNYKGKKDETRFIWTVRTSIKTDTTLSFNDFSTSGSFIYIKEDIIFPPPPPTPKVQCPPLPFWQSNLMISGGLELKPGIFKNGWMDLPYNSYDNNYMLDFSVLGVKKIKLFWNEGTTSIWGIPHSGCPEWGGVIQDGSTYIQIWKAVWEPFVGSGCRGVWTPLIYGTRNYVDQPYFLKPWHNEMNLSKYIFPTGGYLIKATRCGRSHYIKISTTSE